MKRSHSILALSLSGLVVLGLLWLSGIFAGSGGDGDVQIDPNDGSAGIEARESGDLREAATPELEKVAERESLAKAGAKVHGVVLSADTGTPVAGVEVLAYDRLPQFAQLEVRIQDLLRLGFWKKSKRAGPKVLARTTTGADGSFELEGLSEGRVFLDARSGAWYSRTPKALRLAGSEWKKEQELLVKPGGRVMGKVLAPDGEGISGARIVLRPDINSILTQLTNRSLRYYEVNADEDGVFDISGVPVGKDYMLSAMAPGVAMASQGGIVVHLGQSTSLRLQTTRGATVTGIVRTPEGKPAPGAWVGYAYLDLSRILFSVDGENPVRADDEGRFVLPHVASGEVAFAAMQDRFALAPIQTLVVGEGGGYELEFELTEGFKLEGKVIDEQGQPVKGAKITAMAAEQQRGGMPDMSFIARLRSKDVLTDDDGKFTMGGLEKGRVLLQASKAGYIDAMEMVRDPKNQEKPVELKLKIGGFVVGKVVDDEGKPVTRFRVSGVTTEPLDKKKDEAKAKPVADKNLSERERRRQQWRERMGNRRGGGNRARGMANFLNGGSLWNRDGDHEIQNAKGEFRVGPFELGKVRITVRADGYLRPEKKSVDILPGKTQEPLQFELTKGSVIRGQVLAGGRPVSEAQVTWRKPRGGGGRGMMPFQINIQPEDFDFLALSSAFSRRSTLTDSQGRFELVGVEEGKLQVQARHPDYAKGHGTDVKVEPGKVIPEITIQLSLGGAIEGNVTGLDERPVKSAMVVAFSIQKGAMKSGTTDERGYYKIEALAPGTYVVFKTRMDASVVEIWTGAMNDFRLKSTSVKEGETRRVDIKDRTKDGVDIFGRVLMGGQPAPKAMVSLIGQDKAGPFGVGLRSGSADEKGEYKIGSVAPGRYFVRLRVFEGKKSHQASIQVDVPRGRRKHKLDLYFPSGSLSGLVTDRNGQPVAGVRLIAVAEEGEAKMTGLLGLMASAGGSARGRSDAQGAFKISRIPPGIWTIRAEPRGEAQDRFAVAELRGVRIVAGQKLGGLRVEVPDATVLTGIVVDGNGMPVEGANIRMWRGQALSSVGVSEASSKGMGNMRALLSQMRQRVRSGKDGRFKIRGLLTGDWNLEATKKGLSTTQMSIKVLGGKQPEQRVLLVRGGQVFVKVIDMNGTRFPRGTVRVLNSKGQQVGNAKSLISVLGGLFKQKKKDGDGNWIDYGILPPDSYTLEVREKDKDGKEVVRKVMRTLAEGETARWEISYEELLGKQ